MGERGERFIEQAEVPMLVLAALAVSGYLLDLAGVLRAAGLDALWPPISFLIDLVFVADVVAKSWVQRGTYWRSPWFLVDLVCSVPVLSGLDLLPTTVQGLRFVRAFRVLRVLRTLRGLRSLRMLQFAAQQTETVEQRRFDVALTASVTVYTVAFLALSAFGRNDADGSAVLVVGGAPISPHPTDAPELYLVLGSLLGMMLALVAARFQIPALWSRQMRALLNVALPQQVAEHLMKHPEAYDQTVRAPATVMFCDIKGFTATVEALSLEQVKTHLERALDVVVEAHVAQDLIIDKYIGDSVMSFRGGNLVKGDPSDHAWRVVRGALDGARALESLGDPFFREVKVGCASANAALIGTFGTSKRLSYTILGDRVNLAARLEGSCNALGVRNLCCDLTHELLADKRDLLWRRVGRMRVQGRDESTLTWEVFDAGAPAAAWIDTFHQALAAYEARDFVRARSGFTEVQRLSGGDALSAYYVERCDENAGGVPDDWSPLLVTRK